MLQGRELAWRRLILYLEGMQYLWQDVPGVSHAQVEQNTCNHIITSDTGRRQGKEVRDLLSLTKTSKETQDPEGSQSKETTNV